MYRPQTVEQFKIHQMLSETLETGDLSIFPISRNTLGVEDSHGSISAFSYRDSRISDAVPPIYLPDYQAKNYLRGLRANGSLHYTFSFEDTTRWWLDNPSPLSHRQILGLSQHLYRHYLRHRLLDDDEALLIAAQSKITESQFKDLTLWYMDRHRQDCWLGWMGIDMIGELYGLFWQYGTPREKFFLFYISKNPYQNRYRTSNTIYRCRFM